MSQDTSYPSTSTNRIIRLPPNERVPRTSERYVVLGIRLNGEFNIGVRVPGNEDRSIEQFPHTVHEILPDIADDAVDLDRLRSDTTYENWPLLGTVTLSRENGDTVKVDIEWLPPYLQTPVDETE